MIQSSRKDINNNLVEAFNKLFSLLLAIKHVVVNLSTNFNMNHNIIEVHLVTKQNHSSVNFQHDISRSSLSIQSLNFKVCFQIIYSIFQHWKSICFKLINKSVKTILKLINSTNKWCISNIVTEFKTKHYQHNP